MAENKYFTGSKEEVDQRIQELIEDINRRKKEIQKLDKPTWKTNLSFSVTADWSISNTSNIINLHVESSLHTLVSIVAFLKRREASFKEAVKELGLDSIDFRYQGYLVSDWIEDIKTRISKLQISTKKSSLEALETRLNAIVSPELRAKLELDAITKELQ